MRASSSTARVGVQPGWQVFVRSTPLARPLVDAVQEQIARRGAFPFLQLAWEQFGGPFAREAPLELLAEPAPLQLHMWENCDAFISISAPENVREGSDLSDERRKLLQKRIEPLRRRQMAMEVPWVICEYPTNAAAQEAGMTLAEYEEFVYGAVLLDWDAEASGCPGSPSSSTRPTRCGSSATGPTSRSRSPAAAERSTTATSTCRAARSSTRRSRTRSKARSRSASFPRSTSATRCRASGFVFERGRIVDASAASGEDFLLRTLDTDEGARSLGELGIGCNPGIQRFTKNLGFDEKIDGTVHLAIGNSYSSTGGTNVSAIHWDMVKDLRNGGRLYADGKLVQEDGRWL